MSERAAITDVVERDALGRVTKGSAAINPGGFSAHERQARHVLRLWLASEMLEKGKAAYAKALDDGNPAIIKDWADRLMGKVKERVELSEDADAPLLGGWSLNDVLKALQASREKP